MNAPTEPTKEPTSRNDDICDVPGILVGHDTQVEAGTGCTVLVCERPAVGGVEVRGGAPATREVALLAPTCIMQEVHAILLTGGSAFGLAAADGVMRALEGRGIGFDTGIARVPIVPAAAIFDLEVGRSDVRPDAAAGARAVEAARKRVVAQGSVGAGTGATVAKLAGPAGRIKGGIGSASIPLGEGHTLGALVAVNAVGDIYDVETGALLAGARRPNQASGTETPAQWPYPATNTTIGILATDLPLGKADLTKLAQMGHDGYALAIRPTHLPFDGDTLFALSTAPDARAVGPASPAVLAMIGALASVVVARAIARAVRAATSVGGVPALRDLDPARAG